MILNHKILTGNTRDIQDLKVGDEVAIEKQTTDRGSSVQEVYHGTVLKVSKEARWTVYLDVPNYFKAGTHRTRWKQKPKAFANSSKIKIHLINQVSSTTT